MKNTLSAREVAQLLGVTTKTVQRWDRTGKLKPIGRQPSGYRIYDAAEVRSLIGQAPFTQRRVVVYCRVSSAGQKDDLRSQRQALELFVTAQGIAVDEWIEETGSGLNFRRKKFLALMDAVGRGEISRLIIAHKDRLVRFGFEWFEHHCQSHGTELLVMNQERLSPETEMTQDLMTIVHCFSCRLYGLRKYKKNLKAMIEEKET